VIADTLSRTLTIAAAIGLAISTLFIVALENARLTASRQAALVDRAQLIVTRMDALIGDAETLATVAERSMEVDPGAATRQHLSEALARTPFSGLTAYDEDGALILEVGAAHAAAVRLQSFAPSAGHAVGGASPARIALLGSSNAGRVQTLVVNSRRASEALRSRTGVRGVSAAIPADFVRAWLASSDTLPDALQLRMGAPDAGAPWVELVPLGEDAGGVAPRNPLSAAAVSADRSFSVVVATARPSLEAIAAAVAPLWALMLTPALALIGAVVLRRRFLWRRLERQFLQTETHAAVRSEALALAGVGLVTWDLDTAKVAFTEAWRGLLGYSGAEVFDEISEWLDRIHPEDRDRCLANYQALLDARAQRFEHEARLLARDGSYQSFVERGQRATSSNTIVVTLTPWLGGARKRRGAAAKSET